MLKFRKKHKGSQFLEFVCTIPLIIYITVVLLSPCMPAINKAKAQVIYRKYMFSMVKEGYLTDSNRLKLISDLEDKGFKNVTVQANSEKVKWGDEVKLKVEFDMPVNKYKSFKEGFTEEYQRTDISNESIGLSS